MTIPTELSGHVVFMDDGSTHPITAHITGEYEEGCRVYVAELSILRLISSMHIDALPAHSTVRLKFIPPGDIDDRSR